MLETYFIYNSALFLAVVFAWFAEKSYTYNKICIGLSFLVLFALSSLRFDVGYDYYNYVSSFKEMYYHTLNNIQTKKFFEYSLYDLTCFLFSFTRKGYIYVFSVYSFFTLFFIYKALLYKKILPLGLFFLISYNFLFISFDQIRQFLAISIFVYSVKFIEERSLKKYVLFIFIAALVHPSVLIVLPFYFIYNYIPKFEYWIGIILLFILGFYLGFWEGVREQFYNLVPYYKFYLAYKNQLISVKLNSNYGVVYLITITVISLWYLKENKEHLFFYATALGLILYLFASNNLNIYRVANYFLIFQCLSIPLIIKKQKKTLSLITCFFIVTAFIMFQMNIKNSPRGTSPYKTIFLFDGQNEMFYGE